MGIVQSGTRALDAPLAEGGDGPLVALSQGSGGSAAQLSWLAEPRVQAGFIPAGSTITAFRCRGQAVAAGHPPARQTDAASRAALPQACVQLLDDAGHCSFLARCHACGKPAVPGLCWDPGSRGREAVHAQVAGDAVAFSEQRGQVGLSV